MTDDASISLTCDLWALVNTRIKKLNFEFKKGVGIAIKSKEIGS